jgi:hypothetical protein
MGRVKQSCLEHVVCWQTLFLAHFKSGKEKKTCIPVENSPVNTQKKPSPRKDIGGLLAHPDTWAV